MKRGVIEYRITGILDIPIKFFGVAKLFSISIPYDRASSSSLKLPISFVPVTVIDAGWNPSIVSVGKVTTAYVVLKSSEAISGIVKLVIKKDLVLQPDQEVTSEVFSISLYGEKYIEIQFVPTETTSISLRGYHIEVYFNDEKIYSMPDSYPPRLKVVGGVIIQYLNTKFEGGGKSGSIISVPIGTVVDVYVEINVGVSVSGTLIAEIRKDYRGAPDEVLTILTKSLDLTEGQHWICLGSFIANEETNGLRQYFIRVLWEDQLIFDSKDPETRPHVTTFIPVTVSGKLTYSDAKFIGAGKEDRIISIPIGTIVDIHVAVSVSEAPVEGTLTVEVCKDIVSGIDQIETTLTKTVSLNVGTHWISIGSFIVNEETGNLPGNIRQYFIRVKWNEKLIYDSTDPNTRPHVTTFIPTVTTETYSHIGTSTTTREEKFIGILVYSDAKFVGAGKEGRIISVPVGTKVDIYLAVSVSNAPVEGMLIVEVRKDIVLGIDQLVGVLTKTVSLTTGAHWVYIGSFIASDKTGNLPGNTRQYFVRIKWNEQLIFDSEDLATRPHVTTY
ncbi:MAG: hypothetical protein QXL51_03740 [Candidatus Aenigmatarchaeota archaeon]